MHGIKANKKGGEDASRTEFKPHHFGGTVASQPAKPALLDL